MSNLSLRFPAPGTGRPTELLRNRLETLAGELLLSRGAQGCSVGDLRYSAENRGLLTGDESEAFMNALRLGHVIRAAGGFPNGDYRRSRAKRAKRSLNAVYTLREFLPVDQGVA